MKTGLVLVLAMICSCSAALDRARESTVLDRVMLGASSATIVLDGLQTHSAAAIAWGGGRYEYGTLLSGMAGSSPTVRETEAYFASTIAVNAVLWLLLPKHWRSAYAGAVAGVQARTIANNWQHTSILGGF